MNPIQQYVKDFYIDFTDYVIIYTSLALLSFATILLIISYFRKTTWEDNLFLDVCKNLNFKPNLTDERNIKNIFYVFLMSIKISYFYNIIKFLLAIGIWTKIAFYRNVIINADLVFLLVLLVLVTNRIHKNIWNFLTLICLQVLLVIYIISYL